MFKLNDVTKIYFQGEQPVTALCGLELEIGQAGFFLKKLIYQQSSIP